MIYQSLGKQIGVTDEVTICDCCGKENLKRTVIFENDEDDFNFLGTTCALNVKRYANGKKNTNKVRLSDIKNITLKGERNGIKVSLKWDCVAKGLYFIAGNGEEERLMSDIDRLAKFWFGVRWQGDIDGVLDAVKQDYPKHFEAMC